MLTHIHPSPLRFACETRPGFNDPVNPAQRPEPVTAKTRQVPRAPLPTEGVTSCGAMSRITSEGVTPPSSLLRAHAPDQIPPTAYGRCLGRRVFAGCRQPLLGDGLSRHYLCNPYVGAWTPTPRCSPGALARFFPGDNGLTPILTSSAHPITPVMQLQQGPTFRGCSHSLMFRLLRLLALQVAPTAEALSSPGRPGRLHHASPGWLPAPGCGIATCPTRATDTAGLSPAGLQPCRLLPEFVGTDLRRIYAPY